MHGCTYLKIDGIIWNEFKITKADQQFEDTIGGCYNLKQLITVNINCVFCHEIINWFK